MAVLLSSRVERRPGFQHPGRDQVCDLDLVPRPFGLRAEGRLVTLRDGPDLDDPFGEVICAVPDRLLSPRVVRSVVQSVFNRVIGNTQPMAFSLIAFLEYCRLRREVEASRFQYLKVAELQQFRALRSRFAARAFDDLYARWLRSGDGSIWSTEVASAAPPPCALQVHELGIRYDEQRTAKSPTSHESQVTRRHFVDVTNDASSRRASTDTRPGPS